MEEVLNLIIPSAVALVITIIGYLKSRVENKRISERLDSIVDVLHNPDNNYYVLCPTCGRKILLAKVEIKADSVEGGKAS